MTKSTKPSNNIDFLMKKLIEETNNQKIKWKPGLLHHISAIIKHNEEKGRSGTVKELYFTKRGDFYFMIDKEIQEKNSNMIIIYIMDSNLQVQLEYNEKLLAEKTLIDRLFMVARRDGLDEGHIIQNILDSIE
ncbi:hypothetical protein RJI07_06230 [Mycoplasmatota bacterium WC30]